MLIKLILTISILFCFESSAQTIDSQTFNKIEFYEYYDFKKIGSLVDHGKIKTCPMLLHIETIKDLFK